MPFFMSRNSSRTTVQWPKGAFTNYVDKFMTFFDHLPPYVDIFYGINVDKKRTFLDHLLTSTTTYLVL